MRAGKTAPVVKLSGARDCHKDMKTHYRTLHRLVLGALAVLAALGLAACSTSRSLTYEQMRQEYDPNVDGYNYADDYDDYYYDYMGY